MLLFITYSSSIILESLGIYFQCNNIKLRSKSHAGGGCDVKE